MLTEKQISQLREEVQCRPVIYFDDDPDGLASYLLIEKLTTENKPVPVKSGKLGEIFAPKAIEWDKAIILDVAIVDQEFIDALKKPAIWIDHHPKQERTGITQYKGSTPTTYLCWQVNPIDWIGAVGCISDWYMPGFAKEFAKKYPDILNEKASVEQAIYENEIGKLIKIFSFALKGTMQDVKKNIRMLRKIKTPYEILRKETTEGRLLYEKYEKINREYQPLLKRALSQPKKDNMLIYLYEEDEHSLTKDLANEVLYHNPKTLVIIGREKSGEIRCSLRHSTANLQKAVEKSMKDIRGKAGGHEHACGASIQKEDWPKFLENLKTALQC